MSKDRKDVAREQPGGSSDADQATVTVAGMAQGTVKGELPSTIGPFEVLEVLGRGGMGVVFLARQTDPVDRKVAVKLIRRSFLGDEAALRFEAERRVMARLTHPNVAQLYEAGKTEAGYPYFAMEYVDGERITDFCDHNRLTLEERLELFAAVCRGVQHAHQKGIIHRDIKASNVMVTEIDGERVAKVIDFGIAKIKSDDSEDADLTGRYVVGTLDYMSPESVAAADGSLDLDTRSDVYSLGILLFELLVGARPFSRRDGSTARALIEIAEGETPVASTHFRSLDPASREAAAAARSSTANRLHGRLRGDLDWIVARATAREREQRYDSAAGLGADVGRYLISDPVLARPPSLRYRLGRLMARHRLATAASIVAVLSLVAGLGMAVVGLARANEARAVAQEERAAAEKEARKSKATTDFLTSMLRAVEPSEARGEEVSVRQVLDEAAARLDEDNDIDDEPEVVIAVRQALGETYYSLGELNAGRTQLQAALELARAEDGENSETYAKAFDRLALIEWTSGRDFVEAERLMRESLENWVGLRGRDHSDVAGAHNDLSTVLAERGKLDEAETHLIEALAIFERHQKDAPTKRFVQTMNNYGVLLADLERFEEALEIHQQNVELRRTVEGDPSPGLATTLNNMAFCYHGLDRTDEALATWRRSLAMQRKVYGPRHQYVALTALNLGRVTHVAGGDLAEAEALVRDAIEIYASIDSAGSWTEGIGRAYLGGILIDLGRPEDAEDSLLRAYGILERTLGEDHARTQAVALQISRHLETLGRSEESALWGHRAGESG